MNKEYIQVKDTELPEDQFKCDACCVDDIRECSCGDSWHYEKENK